MQKSPTSRIVPRVPERLFATRELQRWRKEKGLTQQEMVSLIRATAGTKMPRSYYSEVERGRKTISLDQALFISRFLKKSLSTLFISHSVITQQEAQND